MNTSEIYANLKNLQRGQVDAEAFYVFPLFDMQHKIGISVEGYPKFFVSTNDSASSTNNIVREILSVEYNLSCSIVENGELKKEDRFTIITLRSLEETLQKYFIEIFVMMLQKLPSSPSRRELALEVEHLITIFSALSKPPVKKMQGLWTELLIIERSLHPETLINAWHIQPNAKYDFISGRDKIEVKSTSSEERTHHFSLDQLNPTPNSRLLIASAIVRESGQGSGGVSIRGLYDMICERVAVINARLKLSAVMAETIGSDYNKLETTFFDYTTASDTLEFYDSNDVPHISKENVPEFVSDVKFESNLSHLKSIREKGDSFDRSNSILFKSLY